MHAELGNNPISAPCTPHNRSNKKNPIFHNHNIINWFILGGKKMNKNYLSFTFLSSVKTVAE